MSDIILTVMDDMRLLISPAEVGRDSEHNSALFKITQPAALDQYTCRAEVETASGTTYRAVSNGEFALTNDMTVRGLGRLQLSYSDGVDVMRKTSVAAFHVTGSLNAVDESAPGFGDGLAQITGSAFASADIVGLTINFYNLGGQLVSSVTSPAGGVPEVPTTPNGAYARVRNGGTTSWQDFTTMRVASLDSPQFAGVPTAPTVGAGSNSDSIATTQWTQNQFNVRDYLPRTGGQMNGPLITIPGTNAANLGIAIGDNSTGFYRPSAGVLIASVSGVNVTQFMPTICAFFVPIHVGNNVVQSVGDATADTDALNRQTGDSRYLQQTTADARYVAAAGGIMTGDLRMQSASGPDAEISLYLGGRAARIYWGNSIVLRRGGQGESVYIENNNGSNRSEVLTQLLGDARYLQQPAADTRYLQLAAGGIVAGPLQVLTPPVIANDVVTKGYVDGQLAPTAFRTFAFTPNELSIAAPLTTPTVFLDVNVTLPPGLRSVLVTVDPVFAANDPQGAMWSLIYSTDLIALESPLIAYKFTNETTGMLRGGSAKFTAAVDASSGSVRVVLRVRCPAVQGGTTLTQVGVGGTIAPNMRTIVTVQDLGPV